MSRHSRSVGSSIPELKSTPENISARLDHYHKLVTKVLLSRQDPISGLMPASTAINAHGNYTDAWVRDNVYSIIGIWGLAVAYRKVDWDHGRTYELEQSVVKTMRGLLFAMMRQAGKVERFKQTQSPQDALHAKYDTATGNTVVGDGEWGHLQIDATSLWLLMLGQMTASGLSILFTIDEVNFVQNLVYYIGRAYRTPDYGIWERGNKINDGDPELNASSIGMAKAALEALHSLDLFGVRGSQSSVLHVMADEIARSRITLESLLPWESSSKEVDAATLSVIGFPAFAVEDEDLARRTRDRVVEQLQGRYGCKRFLRDGHQTVIEDPHRLHYESWELKQFDNIESEWPLFFVYLMLDALFREDAPAVAEYRERLKSILIERDDIGLVPELYYVPANAIDAERKNPNSQLRMPNANVPLVWAQSLYYLALMLDEGLLQPGEIDPLGRRLRLGSERDPVVQIVLLTEDESLRFELEAQGVECQTPQQIEPIEVRHAGELSAAYSQIGRNDKLSLTGRPSRRLRSLTTSRLFVIRGQTMVFLPSFLDPQKFYLMLDRHYLVAQIKSELAYIQKHWRELGRPTVTILLSRTLIDTGRDALLELIQTMKMGRCGAVHVKLGRIGELRRTSGMERIDFLHDYQFSQAPVTDSLPDNFRVPADLAKSTILSRIDELEIDQVTDDDVITTRFIQSKNLYEQIELIAFLARRHGITFCPQVPELQGASLQELLEDIYTQAARGTDGSPFWSIVRHAAGLLDKTDVALNDAITDILVRQKQIVIGKSYSGNALIARPLPPAEVRQKIREFCGDDVRDWVMAQEILIYLGSLVRTKPKLFEGLMTLRIGYLMLLIVSEIAESEHVRQEDAHEILVQMAPSNIQAILHSVVGDYDERAQLLRKQELLPLQKGTISDITPKRQANTPSGGWKRFRQKEGALSRVPSDFYPQVWNLLKHCKGLIIGDKFDRRNRLESSTILSETTSGEKNFALWIEHLLNKMDAVKYRRLNIEAMTALSVLARESPELLIDDFIVIDVIVGHAVRLSWMDSHSDRSDNYDDDKSAAWDSFYESAPEVCSVFFVKALQFLTEA